MNNGNHPAPKGCALIPAFMEERRITSVVKGALEHISPVVVVDDGSSDHTAAAASSAGAIVIRHTQNLGKGAALNTGFAFALKEKFNFVITMDADGQHAPGDIPRFIEAFRSTGTLAVVGNRMADPRGMPLVRKMTNFIMSWHLSRLMRQPVPDTQCGFRLYGARVLPLLMTDSDRFAAESETLLRLAENKVQIASVPITVIYSDERSKIRPVRDTLRFFAMTRKFRKGHRAYP